MSIPNWWEFILLALAAFRVWKLIGDDTILDRPRDWARLGAFKLGGAKAKHSLETLIECPWCAGFWISIAWWGAWEAWPHGTLVAATPFALSAVVGIVGSLGQD